MWATATQLFRPRCSPAVRHQGRLEMLFCFVPFGGALSVVWSALLGEKQSQIAVIVILHVVILLPLILVGLWMKNSLHSLGHYLEDARRSNDLLVASSYFPLVNGTLMLFIGSSQDIADTSLSVLGFLFLYVPLLDAADRLVLIYAFYSCLAVARAHYLRPPDTVLCTNYLLRAYAIETSGFLAAHLRLWHLRKSRIDLTPQLLETTAEPRAARQDAPLSLQQSLRMPMLRRRKQGEVVLFSMAENYHQHGAGAARIVESIRERRTQAKDALVGQFLWAVYLHREGVLTPDALAHILSFVEVTVRPVSDCVGLLSHEGENLDATSQVSTISEARQSSTHATSSMTSVTLLRRDLSDGLHKLFGVQPARSDHLTHNSRIDAIHENEEEAVSPIRPRVLPVLGDIWKQLFSWDMGVS